MPDHGRRYADRKIKKVDRELQGIYRQAEKELTKKLADFVANSKEQDRLKQKQRDAGLITEEEYQSWLKGQVFQKKRWEAKIKQVQQVMYNHNVEAAKIVHENKMDVFAENYNYQAFMTEGITGVSFDIYDTDAVAMLIKDRPDLLPEWKIDEEKDYDWNYRKVNNAITQGIIQGESVDKVMRRLCDNLSTQNENKMRMFARTAINEAESAGRQKQMEDSAKKGIRIEKEWLATLDSRTRDTHRHLDGQRKPYNEPFESDLGDIMFPCDPKADPANVYNCRCTTIPVYPDYEDEQDNWRENETVDGMTYQEWKEGKIKNGNLAYIATDGNGNIKTDISGAETSNGNWEKLTNRIEYGEMFADGAVKVTKDTLDKLYKEYPLSEAMGIVGDIRVIRNLDMDADGLDLAQEYGFGAHYLYKGNSFVQDGKAGIEVLNENYSLIDLRTEFKERHELRLRYGYQTKATAFYTSSDTLEGTIVHEYAHALQEEYGLTGGSRSKAALDFSSWLYGYFEANKENARQISNYAAEHPFEMMAEAFVQIHDIEHQDTIAYKVAREIWDEFDNYRFRRGRYSE